MVGECPECGFHAPLTAFVLDIEWKQAWMLSLDGVPQELRNGNLIRYLALFQPKKRKLTAQRAAKVLQDLIALVSEGSVDWDRIGRIPAPPWLWAAGIRAIVEMEPEKRPKHLEDHNYLRRTVWNKANRLAGKAEAQREEALRCGARGGDAATLRAHGDPLGVGEILAGAFQQGGDKRDETTCLDCRHMHEAGLCYLEYEATKRVRQKPPPYRVCDGFEER